MQVGRSCPNICVCLPSVAREWISLVRAQVLGPAYGTIVCSCLGTQRRFMLLAVAPHTLSGFWANHIKHSQVLACAGSGSWPIYHIVVCSCVEFNVGSCYWFSVGIGSKFWSMKFCFVVERGALEKVGEQIITCRCNADGGSRIPHMSAHAIWAHVLGPSF